MWYLIDGLRPDPGLQSITRIVVAAALAVTFACLGHPVAAHALVPDPDFWKQSAENQDTVNRLIYAESPQSIPSSYSAVEEAEELLRAREQALPPSNPEAPAVWQQLRGVTVRSSLSAPLRGLGTIGLAVGTFELGWKIGSGVNAKFLHIGIPEATDPTVDYRWTEIRWTTAESQTYAGAEWPAADGWLISMRQTCCSFDATTRWFNSPCPFSGFTPPPPFAVGGPVATTTQCYGTGVPPGYADASVYYGWASEDALTAAGPIEDYDSQSYSKTSSAPTPDSQSTVEDTIEDELDLPGNDVLRQWLNYQLGSPGEADPLGIGPDRPDIGFPDRFRHWEDHGEEFPEYEDADEYWEGAADVVRKATERQEGFEQCERSDGALIYWDIEKRAIVIVKDGVITTFFKPDTGDSYYLDQCNR